MLYKNGTSRRSPSRPWKWLEDTERTARRVLGGAHPITPSIELALRCAQKRAAPARRAGGFAGCHWH